MSEENNLQEVPAITGKKKGKGKFIILTIVIIAALAVGLYFGYKNVTSDPYGIYKSAINDTYDLLSKAIKETGDEALELNAASEPFRVDLQAKLTSSMEELSTFTAFTYDINISIDLSKNAMQMGLNLTKDSDKADFILAVLDNNGYLKSNFLLDKVIDLGEVVTDELDSEELNYLENLNLKTEDLEYVLVSYRDILINCVDKSAFKIENVMLSEKANKKYGVLKKVTYEMTKENTKASVEYIVNETLKNEKLLEILASITDSTVSEIKTTLEELKNTDYSDFENVDINIYTDKTNNVIIFGLNNATDKLYITNVDDVVKGSLITDTEKLEFTYEEDKLTMQMYENDALIIDLNISIKDKEQKYSFEMSLDGETIKGSLALSNIKSTTDKFSSDFKLEIDVNGETIGLEGTLGLTEQELDMIDTSNAVTFEELTEVDSEKLYNNLLDFIDKFGLTDLFGELM